MNHRRVIELRLVIGGDVQQLGGHVAREHVRLELLREDGPPHVLPSRLSRRRALAFGDRRQLPPGEIAHLPLLALRKLVEAENAGKGLPAFSSHLYELARRHSGRIYTPTRRLVGPAEKPRGLCPRGRLNPLGL